MRLELNGAFKGNLLIWWTKIMLFRGKTHYEGGQKCCHIVLFSRGVHAWTPTMVILEHIFPNLLHNLVDHNIKNLIKKKIHFSNLYCVIPKYICAKKMYAIMY
jgi:hypothetical protein